MRSGIRKTLLGWEVCSCEICRCFTQKTPLNYVGRGKNQPQFNVEWLRNGNRYTKYVNEPWLWNWGLFFRFRQQNLCETPLVEKSQWRHIRFYFMVSEITRFYFKPRYLGNHVSQITVTMERYQEVVVALSESVIWNRLKRPLVEKSSWRHIRIAINPRYLGNHASQLKSYYLSRSGNHILSFRIHYEKSPEAPLGGEITMTSYPVWH